jgi:hypothetical protein
MQFAQNGFDASNPASLWDKPTSRNIASSKLSNSLRDANVATTRQGGGSTAPKATVDVLRRTQRWC